MRPRMIVAGILIALAVVVFAYQGVTYTTRERAVDLGPLHVTTERTHTIPLPLIVGAVALIGGCALLLMNRKGLSPAS